MKYGKVLTYKDAEEARKLIGKKVIISDNLCAITEIPETRSVSVLKSINCESDYLFDHYQFIREIIEEPAELMTNRQLAEWTGKRIGEYTYADSFIAYTSYGYSKSKQNDPVPYNLLIRPWNSEEWVLPTVDIYERDCKGGNK